MFRTYPINWVFVENLKSIMEIAIKRSVDPSFAPILKLILEMTKISKTDRIDLKSVRSEFDSIRRIRSGLFSNIRVYNFEIGECSL